MPALIDFKYPDIVNTVSKAAFVGTQDLSHLQDDFQFLIVKSIEMRL